MADQAYLGPGDGPVAGAIDLTTDDIYIVAGTLDLTDLPNGKVRFDIEFRGNTDGEVQRGFRSVDAMLRRARNAAKMPVGPYAPSQGVTLSLRLSTADWAFIDILRGTFTKVDYSEYFPRIVASVELDTLRVARGAMITDAVSGTIVSGDAGWVFRADVPGDRPALVRMTIADVSINSKVIQLLRVSAFALPDMADDDFDSIISLTAASGATSESDTDTANGTGFSRRALTAGDDWQAVGYATVPAARYAYGSFDVWLRTTGPTTTLPATPNTPTGSAASWFTVVQSNSGKSDPDQSVGTFTAILSQASREGSTLVVAAVINKDDGYTLSPDGDGAWLPAGTGTRSGKGKAWAYVLQDAPTMLGDKFTVTPGPSGVATSGSIAWAILELGNTPAVSLDQFVSSTAGSGTSIASGTTPALSQAFEYLVGAFVSFASGGTTVTPPTGFTEQSDQNVNNSSAQDITLEVATKAHTTGGTVSASATAAASGERIGILLSVLLDGGLRAGTYHFRVRGNNLDGSKGEWSSVYTVTVSDGQYVPLAWANGDATSHYDILWDRDGGQSYVFPTPTNASSYDFYYEHGTPTTLPAAPIYNGASVRARVGLESGTILVPLTPPTIEDPSAYDRIRSSMAKSSAVGWGWTYLGRIDLPMLPSQEGASAPHDWRLEIQARHPSASGNLDADCVFLAPHNGGDTDSQLLLYYLDDDGEPYTLAAARTWVYDLNRYGLASAILKNSGSEAGHVAIRGALMLPPGGCLVTIVPEIADGVSDMENAKVTVTLEITPLFAYGLPGV